MFDKTLDYVKYRWYIAKRFNFERMI